MLKSIFLVCALALTVNAFKPYVKKEVLIVLPHSVADSHTIQLIDCPWGFEPLAKVNMWAISHYGYGGDITTTYQNQTMISYTINSVFTFNNQTLWHKEIIVHNTSNEPIVFEKGTFRNDKSYPISIILRYEVQCLNKEKSKKGLTVMLFSIFVVNVCFFSFYMLFLILCK